jgi:hypothetical protein
LPIILRPILSCYHYPELVNFSMRWWSGSLCTRPTCLVGFFNSASSLKQQSGERDGASFGDTLSSDSEPTSLCSSVVDHGFESWSAQTKDYEIGICCFSAKHVALRRKSKDWLVRNQKNVSEWSDMVNNCELSLFTPTM